MVFFLGVISSVLSVVIMYCTYNVSSSVITCAITSFVTTATTACFSVLMLHRKMSRQCCLGIFVVMFAVVSFKLLSVR